MHAELFRFIVVGVGSNTINFITYLLAYAIGMPLAVSSAMGYLVGLFNSYYLGKIWVFRMNVTYHKSAVTRFVLVYALGGLGMSAIIEVLDRVAGLDYRLSWLIGAIFAFTNNFLGSKLLVFRGCSNNE